MKITDTEFMIENLTVKSTVIVDPNFDGMYRAIVSADENEYLLRLVILSQIPEYIDRAIKESADLIEEYLWKATDYYKWSQKKKSC